MAGTIFPSLEVEPIVQVNDRTRLNASKSFATPDAGSISKVEIDPGTGSFLDITPTDPTDSSLYHLDYAFATAGTKTIQCRITCGSNGPTTVSKTLSAVTEASDQLFSADSDLQVAESDILKYVQAGRNTFKNVHRAAQDEIIRYFDEQGYVDANGVPLTKAAVIDNNEVRLWAKFMVLRMIFEDLSNTSEDKFEKKAAYYQEKEVVHRGKSLIRLDIDGDGQTDVNEGLSISTGNVFRR